MNIESYLTMKCSWTKKGTVDEEFMTPSFEETSEINCFKYGSTLGLRTSDTNTEMSDMTYLVKDNVAIGDKLDGQVVRSIELVPEFDGSEVLYLCHVLKA